MIVFPINLKHLNNLDVLFAEDALGPVGYWPLVLVAASAIFWKVSKKDPRAKIVFLQ